MKRPGNILAITYWPWNSALISTYTLPYLRMIRRRQDPAHQIYLVTLSPANSGQLESFRAAENQLRSEGIILKNFTYQPFGMAAFLMLGNLIAQLGILIITKRITVLHAWCTPGGAIAYLLTQLRRLPIVLDSMEPHAESMVETGTWSKSSMSFKLLFRLEKKQLQKASHVICTTSTVPAYITKTYGLTLKDYFVKPACVDLDLFNPVGKKVSYPPGLNETQVICLYAGKLGGIYLEKEVFEFFAAMAEYWKDRFRVLLLTSHSDKEIDNYCAEAGFDRNLIVKRFVDHAEVPAYMALASFAICPVKPVATKRHCTPIKNGEYWAMGLPVVIPANISDDSDIIREHNAGYVLEELSKAEYLSSARALDLLFAEPGLKSRIRELAVRYRSPAIAEKIYAAVYG
jgi:glycosyltransferase involved in cell wall biosynthesis